MRTTTPIGELKAHLSEILLRVRAGEEVLVADRGSPVARLASYTDIQCPYATRPAAAQDARVTTPASFLSEWSHR